MGNELVKPCCSGEGTLGSQNDMMDAMSGGPGDAELGVKGMMGSPKNAGEFLVTLQKVPGVRLGMDVDLFDGKTLLIEAIGDNSTLAEWNASNPAIQVQKGDRIVAVNGKRGSANELAAMCKKDNSELRLVIGRGGQ
eukprot:TRINITY_DN114793_c0_g1_i1.p1 TRINITY_DN114793_c0_g1~~TRINITY_DN114793_c0_g1_i1.p1  ORF type:complete len:137 (+),score=32.57 TRINITY_DN114793_c0_g1_i1:103-513(+)